MFILKKLLVWILTLESRLILRKYKPFIVAVTGSVGKTSVKDAIFCVLKSSNVCLDRQICYVRKSEKSLNSEIGLPLTIIGVPNAWNSLSGWSRNIMAGFKLIIKKSEYPDCLVLEVGADHPGDIKRVAKWLKPDIAVITKVSRTPVHVEFFSSPEEVMKEKAYLVKGLKKGGKAVLFADDENTASIKGGDGIQEITFGMSEKANVRGTEDMVTYENGIPDGYSFKLSLDGNDSVIKIKGGIGKPYVYSMLAAAAVGKACGLTAETIAQSLNQYEPTKGRLSLIPGINGSTLIDDSYNSSPDAVVSALDVLKDIKANGTKIAVLGDMMELGKHSAEEHRNIGKKVAETVGRLVTVGQRSRATADEAIKYGLSFETVKSFDTATEAAVFLSAMIKTGDIVLIKGSQSMRMERAVKALLRSPEKAEELLVRQEKEWLEKK